MKTLKVKGKNNISTIAICENSSSLSKYTPENNVIIITDNNVYSIYGKLFSRYPVIIIGEGEKNKTLNTLSYIYNCLIKKGASRTSFLVGVGGGIVCDITGFAASTFMRGVRFGFVATTLLAQVDASIGGKNGLNINGYKNMAGTFSQPDFVICNTNMLQTLNKREILCGISEIIKYAVIKDKEMFCFIENNINDILALKPEYIEELIYKSISIKSEIVNEDENEQGIRRILNFGHTYGHAIEKFTCKYNHGEAVAIGMAIESKLSVSYGYLKESEYSRIINLLKKCGLPVNINVTKNDLRDIIKKDKKCEGNNIYLVMIKETGKAEVVPFNINKIFV